MKGAGGLTFNHTNTIIISYLAVRLVQQARIRIVLSS